MHAVLRQELYEVKACIEALRKKIVVPYFHPENISLHQESVERDFTCHHRCSTTIKMNS